MSRFKSFVLIFALLGICLDSKAQEANTWSLSFGDISLFNLPQLGRSFVEAVGSVGVVTENPLNIVDILKRGSGVNINVPEDAHLKTPELIKKYGYPAEIHHVITDDGYILELHRIARAAATPILLMHGLLDSSATWVMMGPDKGLAYLLYDSGYDVWMPNVRGNTYSRNHTKYSTKHAKFWDYTFHEMGKYDLPASIDYILGQTEHDQLHYIGHSQGTMTFWIMCSEHPEYSEKIILMQALAPVAYIKHSKSPVVQFLAFFQDPLSVLLKLIGAHEFLPDNEFMTMFSQMICDEDNWTLEICSDVLFLIVGFDKAQANEVSAGQMISKLPLVRNRNGFMQYVAGPIKYT
uniref:Lipase 1 n=1 Tax=Bactrocera latifrons TaxID=174628 RepID=A0A0K8VD62_BACLA